MVLEASSSITVLLEGIMFFLLIALLYYATSILTSFKRGMLEKGWKYLSEGIIVLVAGEVLLEVSNYFPLGGFLYQLGIGIDAMGVILAVIGFRSHSSIWTIGREQANVEKEPSKGSS